MHGREDHLCACCLKSQACVQALTCVCLHTRDRLTAWLAARLCTLVCQVCVRRVRRVCVQVTPHSSFSPSSAAHRVNHLTYVVLYRLRPLTPLNVFSVAFQAY